VGLERPEHDGVTVDVDTLGDLAVEVRSLLGLTDWRGIDNTGIPLGDSATFAPAKGLGDVHDAGLTVAWGVVQRMEMLNTRFAEGLTDAVRVYGASDRHSARAIAAVAAEIAPGSTRTPGD
jgi:hypothetical protein